MKITYLLALVILFGCKPQEEAPLTSPSNGNILQGSRELGADEEVVGLAICNALAQKDQQYRILNEPQFEFDVSTETCSNVVVRSEGVRMNLDRQVGRQEIFFSPVNYKGQFLKEIQTTTVGALKYFCPDILAGKRVSNQVDTLKGIEKLQIRFTRTSTSQLAFQSAYYTKQLNGIYVKQVEDTVYISTQPTDKLPLKGLVTLHIHAKLCPSTNRLDNKVQHLFSRLFVTR